MRAVREAHAGASVVSDTELCVRSWESHREVLAGFRRGNFPNGFKACEWLELARHFARLKEIYATREQIATDEWWSRAGAELAAAERLLASFEHDPKVFGHVVWASIRR